MTPQCYHHEWRVLETRKATTKTYRRRYECKDCGHRWTRFEKFKLKTGRKTEGYGIEENKA